MWHIGQERMNRETSIHSSDTLVVVDRSRQRRRLVIVGAIAALALFVVGLWVIMGRVVSASGPLAAKRDQPIGIAGQGGRLVRVLVDAGQWVHGGQVLAIVDRSVQAQPAAQ